ncbi:MAG: polysaccharide deacetylase family protein [Clostridia bacterium]|nr:polysaccharide deacetylase family protein [Clostridia bacterium]
MKKIFTFLLSALLLLSLLLSFGVAAKEGAYQWYIKREKDHKQPQIAKEMAWIVRYGGYYADTTRIDNSGEKVLYLTFDAGYENGNVAKILDILKEEEVTGAFFVLSHMIKDEGDLIKRMKAEGHLVCNHTASHKDNTKISEEDLKNDIIRLEKEYTALTGEQMDKYFRPPEGKFTESSLKTVAELGYKTIFWSNAYADWDNNRQMSAEKAKEKLLANTHNGAVILLHPTSNVNAAILREVIQEWKKEGYSFGTLYDLTERAR